MSAGFSVSWLLVAVADGEEPAFFDPFDRAGLGEDDGAGPVGGGRCRGGQRQREEGEDGEEDGAE